MEVIEKERSITINPPKICQPIGAIWASLGFFGTIPLVHGSLGCATYPRYQLARHFREPVEVASTALSEGAAVYGGKPNLIRALKNLALRYQPEMITVITTCLSETIGDDLESIIKEFRHQHPELDAIKIIPMHTPSYVGNHVLGFDNALKYLTLSLAEKSKPHGKLNLIPGMLNPGDILEIKSMLGEMSVESIVLPDISERLDAPVSSKKSYPGTKIEDVVNSANSLATIVLAKHQGGAAARILEDKFGVPSIMGPMPIGLNNTESFLNQIAEISGHKISSELSRERGLLLDTMVDVHQILFGKKVAIFGDPDTVVGLARLVSEVGMEPAIVHTATESKDFVSDVKEVTEEFGFLPKIMVGHDLFGLAEKIKSNPVDLLIGNTKGKFIAKDEKIPLVRVGFPITDRVGYHRRSIVGYRGAIQLLDLITNTLLALKD